MLKAVLGDTFSGIITSDDHSAYNSYHKHGLRQLCRAHIIRRIGNLLAGARIKAGLTQAQLAQKLDVRQNMISDYERGKRRLSPAMGKKIAKILNIASDRLIK